MRESFDFYETAPFQVDALADHLPELTGSILCPCVGDGALMRRLRERRPDLGPFTTNDFNAGREADHHLDATGPELWEKVRPDWVIENVPFSLAMGVLARAWEAADHGVALLVRLSFLEPVKERGQWLADHPPHKIIVLERYSFSQNGSTDSVTACWLVWAKVPIARPFVVAYGYKQGTGAGKRRKREAAPEQGILFG